MSSCVERNAAGCVQFAVSFLGEGDTEGATEAFVDACVYGAREACDRALALTLREEVTSPTFRAVRMLTTLCRGANVRARAADFHRDNLERCSALCRRDVAGACATGLGFASGFERSFLARSGCLLGNALACNAAAGDFAHAASPSGDNRSAKNFFRRACQEGVEVACEFLRTIADGICDRDDECDRHHQRSPGGFCIWWR